MGSNEGNDEEAEKLSQSDREVPHRKTHSPELGWRLGLSQYREDTGRGGIMDYEEYLGGGRKPFLTLQKGEQFIGGA